MKKEFKERVRCYFLSIAKKNRILEKPMLFCMTAVLSAYYVLHHFADNQKRYASIGLIWLFFLLSSSFTFPSNTERSGFVSVGTQEETKTLETADVQTEGIAEESGAVLAQEPVVQKDITILDDEDVLEGYKDAELHGMEESDQYTLDEILEENNIYQRNENYGNAAAEEEPAFNPYDWRYVLINKQHPIPEDYSFELVTIKGSMQCDGRILEELLAMLQAAKLDGVNLVIRSPYRDMSRQEFLFERKINAYMSRGMSYMEAYKTASQAVTVPGASEHQIGLAIDITSDGYASLDEGFGDTEGGKWLAKHSCEYGFILRYPKDKEYITSIEYEPWHFRYVGKEAATVIMKDEISLEEFVENYL